MSYTCGPAQGTFALYIDIRVMTCEAVLRYREHPHTGYSPRRCRRDGCPVQRHCSTFWRGDPHHNRSPSIGRRASQTLPRALTSASCSGSHLYPSRTFSLFILRSFLSICSHELPSALEPVTVAKWALVRS